MRRHLFENSTILRNLRFLKHNLQIFIIFWDFNHVENLTWCWLVTLVWEAATWVPVWLTAELTCLLLFVNALGNEEMVSEWTQARTSVTGTVSNSSVVCWSTSVGLVKSGLCVQDLLNWHLSLEITKLRCQHLKSQFLKKLGIALQHL